MVRQVFHIVPAGGGPIWIFAGVAALLVVLAVLFGAMVYSSRHTSFEVTDDGLRIRGNIYGRFIPFEHLELDRIKKSDLKKDNALQPVSRINGAGLPGFQTGWFRLRNGEKGLLFVTDKQRISYIPTNQGYSIVMSVDDNDALRDLMRKVAAEKESQKRELPAREGV